VAFAAERRAVEQLLLGARRCRSKSPGCTALSSNPPHAAAAVDRWDRQTD